MYTQFIVATDDGDRRYVTRNDIDQLYMQGIPFVAYCPNGQTIDSSIWFTLDEDVEIMVMDPSSPLHTATNLTDDEIWEKRHEISRLVDQYSQATGPGYFFA